MLLALLPLRVWVREIREGTQGGNLEAGTEAETAKEGSLLAGLLPVACPDFVAIALRSGTSPGVALPTVSSVLLHLSPIK